MKTILSLLALLFLSACATVTSPTPGTANPIATVVGQMDRHGGMFTWRSFVPLAVDNKPVSRSFWADAHDAVVQVEPGVRRITLRATFNRGLGSGGPWEAIAVLQTTVEAGKTYRLNGEVRDNQFVVWLEDIKSGVRLAEEGSAPWGSVAQGQSIPIFIPVRK
jgi:hypothetical protein